MDGILKMALHSPSVICRNLSFERDVERPTNHILDVLDQGRRTNSTRVINDTRHNILDTSPIKTKKWHVDPKRFTTPKLDGEIFGKNVVWKACGHFEETGEV
ncbi:hypothetical protein TNCV_546411 [Trichonephila clavipes]|nr:hypothetical protein TNCV_546411 [Trichonephila clavipes]